MSEPVSNKLTVIDLFCGAGGMSKGFEMAGFDIIIGVDTDSNAIKTFERNHLGSTALCMDVKDLTAGRVKEITKGRRVDVIIGGPPCQGFSMAGERDPDDPRNSLFRHFVRLVDELKPAWFVMENVTGLLVAKTASGTLVDTIIKEAFNDVGYKVKRFKLLAADYGVPQKRKRIFYIGTNLGAEIRQPAPTHAETPNETLVGPPIEKWVSVRECLLPESDIDAVYYHSEKMIEGFRRRKERNLKKGKGFGWQILNLDRPSYTISARYHKDGSDAIVMITPDKTRMLTERECARVQSFPDDYIFLGGKKSTYRQVGNAVPPLLAKAIALEIKKNLA